MISHDALERLARHHQTGVFPNIIREYFQHLFLSELYKLPEAEKMFFKGGTALRIVYGSPRFSEDLDFSVFAVKRHDTKQFVEDLFIRTLGYMERVGISVEIGEKSKDTAGGYLGIATFKLLDYRPVGVEINVSDRDGRKVYGEVDSIASDFVPTYTLIHLSQNELVEEKIFGALRKRKKPRDFYDLYFMMRKGMLASWQKRRLAKLKHEILGKPLDVPFNGLDEGTRLHLIQPSEIRAEHHPLTS